ncbi:hypothetical protein CcCBS67573_g05485 [Chytriomyces confervae]|uniref:Uncharacterized protein n=1 Tax=Chytriomyces confervae TaxID=246404 RepID=A0A507FAD0_9FUNG|nr:hypothetical protein CcCBS67573_g05485 [Chytriomyces confervae]
MLPSFHRIVTPGSMQTMDFRPDRTNIHVSAANIVERITQG